MPRGGYRKNAGGKPTWKHGQTKTIRVPVALADKVLEIARQIDEGSAVFYDGPSNVIDLSTLTIPHIRNKKFVFLQDLVRLGYVIKPTSLAQSVKKEMYPIPKKLF